jgi:tyrocidine synthetase-3
MYKTGDRGRWLADGNIEFLGRMDHQVKIRGYRIELGEIENQLLRHRDVKEAAVIDREGKTGDKYLCAYIVVNESGKQLFYDPLSGAEELKTYLSGVLPEYMVPTYIVPLEKLPLTPNGKIDRKLLAGVESIIPAPGKDSAYIAPRSEIEKKLADLWAEVLKISREIISIDSNFFQLGGHSLRATILLSRIHKALDIKVTLAEFFRYPTIRGLAEAVKSRIGKDTVYSSLQISEAKEYYPVSFSQRRLYLLYQLEGKSTVYNVFNPVPLVGQFSKSMVESIFRRLIQRHESFRTSFEFVEGELVQRVHRGVEFEIQYFEASPSSSNSCGLDFFMRPFDLSAAPLLRVGLIKLLHTPSALRGHPSQEGKGDNYLLLVDMHHIITDGTSSVILMEDFSALYQGGALPPLQLQYKDYCEYQVKEREVESFKGQEAYWLKEFSGEIPLLKLPIDFTRPMSQSFEGSSRSFEISGSDTGDLRALALEGNSTLYMVLVAIFTIFLSKLSDQEDIVIGTPVAGRRHEQLQGIIGMFVNTLALRNFPVGEKTIPEFLKELKERTLEAFENQEYPFEELVEKVSVNRDISRNPLFDVMLVFQNISLEGEAGSHGGNLLSSVPFLEEYAGYIEYEHKTAKFDLTLGAELKDNGLIFTFEYCTKLFKSETIDDFIDYFKRVLSGVLAEPEGKISNIEILSKSRKRRLLFDFNATEVEYPVGKSIHDFFTEQVERRPSHTALAAPKLSIAITNLESPTNLRQMGGLHLSYRELSDRVDGVAEILEEKGVGADTIVGIMMERCVNMIIGILGILKSGGAYLPMDPDFPQDRLQYMLSDSGAKVLLITAGSAGSPGSSGKLEELSMADGQLLNVEEAYPAGGRLDRPEKEGNKDLQLAGSNLAYVLYTSGTTGWPKGVIVNHTSMVNVLLALQKRYPFMERDVYLFKTSYMFDVSVTELFGWFLGGGRLAVLEKDGEKDAGKIVETIEKEGVTHINFVPSMFSVLLEELKSVNLDKIMGSLESLRYIFLAGEALLRGLVEGFRALNTKIALENIYGPTEAAVYSSWYSLSGWSGGGMIPIGTPVYNVKLLILGKYGGLQAIGVPGELCIGGRGLARGYLNRPVLTAEKFDHDLWDYQDYHDEKKANLQKQLPGQHLTNLNKKLLRGVRGGGFLEKSPPGGRRQKIYKTGDLARWLADGNIQYLGRIDQQVKLRGIRIECGEIESRLQAHEAVKEAVVIIKEVVEGDSYLCAYVVFRREFPVRELREYLSVTLPGYMIPSYFVALEKIPLSSSGKIERKGLPEPVISGTGVASAYIAPRDEVEEKLAVIWSEVLGLEGDEISIDANFFQLGGHSLKASMMVSGIHKLLDMQIPLGVIFKTPTICGLARYLRQSLPVPGDKYAAIEPVEKREYYRLSSAQKRLYLLQQMSLEGTAYNLPGFIPLAGGTDINKLEQVLNRLIRRYESLRTSFHMLGEEPVQRVHEEVKFEIEYFGSVESETHDFIRPFDLSCVPLLRVGLIKAEGAKPLLMVDIHHIVSDGVSQEIMKRDFIALYSEEELPGLSIQYKDYARWQNNEREQEKITKQEEYWLKEFAGEIPVLNLPTDYPRPAIQGFEGHAIFFNIESKQYQALRQLGREEGLTLYMVVLALFNILLFKLSGQEDIVIGTPVANRPHGDLQQVIGMFVNTLALRNFPRGEKRWGDFLAELKENTLKAFENQAYPFEDLVDIVAVNRDASRNPLFDVMFSFQGSEGSKTGTGGQLSEEIESVPGESGGIQLRDEHRVSKFDLTLTGVESERGLYFHLEYSTRLFQPDTIRRFAVYFKRIISQIPGDKSRRIREPEIISGIEKKQVLEEFNHAGSGNCRDCLLPGRFAEQVRAIPDYIAVVEHGYLTYRELDNRSNGLARLLRSKGVKPDTIVALKVGRSLEMIIGILGILKAGGAYLPIEFDCPRERINYVLADSNVNIVLIRHSPGVLAPETGNPLEKMSTGLPGLRIKAETGENRPMDRGHRQYTTSLAYVIYTSGSTGKPKGVMLEHQGVCNLVYGLEKRIYQRYARGVRVCLISPFIFDASVKQVFVSLLLGHRLHIVPEDIRGDILAVIRFYEKYRIEVSDGTPTYLRLLLEALRENFLPGKLPVKHFIIGGEALSRELVEKFYQQTGYNGSNNPPVIINVYGPTESCVDAALYEINRGQERLYSEIPIGKPMPNYRLYLLDKAGQLQPPGIAGELCISGVGVARGYLNNPGLTFEKFDHNLKRIPPGCRRLYKTGDLARWLPDGNIVFLGRLDRQVKIRGIRIELEEIENLLSAHEKVKAAAAAAWEAKEGEKFLCAYIVPHSAGHVDEQELREYLGNQLPYYNIPSYFMELTHLPLGPGGKMERRSLPAPGVHSLEDVVAPRDEIEKKLVKIWSEVLNSGHDSTQTSIGINSNFFQLGGDSLKAAIMIARIQKTLESRVPLGEIFKTPTIRGLTKYIRLSAANKYTAIEPGEEKEYYVLSSPQKRLYILQQMSLEGTVYNMPQFIPLASEIDTNKLKQTFTCLIRRHESFRTSFHMVGDEPVQKVHEKLNFDIEYFEAQELHKGGADRRGFDYFIRPFDLSCAPLLRVGLIKQENTGYLLMIDMHHIISDGVSQERWRRDFIALYGEEELPRLKLQYKDYAQWQIAEPQRAALKKQESYWLQQFQGDLPVLELSYDYPRPLLQNFEGEAVSFYIETEQSRKLKQLVREEGLTLYMVLLASFNILFSKLSGQEDIVIGTPVANRGHADLHQIIGMFVNTLALRNFPRGEKKLGNFLAELKKNTLKAFVNQAYPFEDLVEKVTVDRDTGRNPVFDVMISHQGREDREADSGQGHSRFDVPDRIEEIEMGPEGIRYRDEHRVSKFDITLSSLEVGETLYFDLEYCKRLFKRETIKRFIGYFKRIISHILGDRDKRLRNLEIIPGVEKECILYKFNNTATVYPRDTGVRQLFEKQAAMTPYRTALIGTSIREENRHEVHLTYKELNDMAHVLALLLEARGIRVESVVGIMMERCIELITGIMGILKAGGAYLPIDPGYPEKRIDYILEDSGLKVLLVTSGTLEKVKVGTNKILPEVIIISYPLLSYPPVDSFITTRPGASFADDLAYIMYTSGSTGVPKGVIVEHRNVVRLVKNTNYVQFKESDRILQVGAVEFDASTFEIWGALLNGLQLCLANKEQFLEARSLKKVIESRGITTLWMTAPYFNRMVEIDLDIFSGLHYLLVGGDVLSPTHINKTRKFFPGLNIINGYGPTENTTFSTTFLICREYSLNIPIGSPISNSTVYILNRYNQLTPIGVPGELWVSGDGVARGYLNNPELTGEKFFEVRGAASRFRKDFIGPSFDSLNRSSGLNVISSRCRENSQKVSGCKRQRIYRTGDLARWEPEGNITFFGRLDHQVKIRGYRIEPGEIDGHLLRHPDIKEAVTVVKEDEKGDKYLCSYIVFQGPSGEKGDEPTIVREFLSNRLPDYMIPRFVVPIGQIPLDANGKIDRRTLPEPQVTGASRYVAPSTPTEVKLVKLWVEVLGIKPGGIGMNDDFFKLGGHSLKAALLVTKIHKVFEVKISLVDIFRLTTLRELAGHLTRTKKSNYKFIEAVDKKEYYVLSSAQKRLYILQQMAPEGMAYNIPQVIPLSREIEIHKLEQIFMRLIRRHESMRTSFHMVGDEPVQKVHAAVEFHIEHFEAHELAPGRQDYQELDSFIRPFDLTTAPLLRVGLIKLEDTGYLLMADMHHIISDGLSFVVLERDFISLVSGEQLPELRVQYRDYAQWWVREPQKAVIKKQESYWLRQLEGDVPVLELPYDYSRPKVQSFEGSIANFEISQWDTRALKALALEQNSTLYLVLLAIFTIFLSKLSGQEDIVIGTPVAGRVHDDLQGIIGMFVNSLVLRNFPDGQKNFLEFLNELTTKTLEDFENQEYPFEELVEKAAVNRDTSRNPLFDVMLVFQDIFPEVESGSHTGDLPPQGLIPGKHSEYDGFQRRIAKFDLTLRAEIENGALIFTFEYCTKLFKPGTVNYFIDSFKRVVSWVLGESGGQIYRIEILSENQKHRLLNILNATGPGYPQGTGIHELFTRQARRTPDYIAVEEVHSLHGLDEKETAPSFHLSLTYRELNKRGDRLAGFLREKGVLMDSIVAIRVERSAVMIAGILGILKAGAAYLPVDLVLPEERLQYMLKDSAAKILLTSDAINRIPTPHHLSLHPSALPRFYPSHSPSLAYVIYTSGTTGRPKGALIEHGNVVRLLFNEEFQFDFNNKDVWTLFHSYSFDFSVWEINGALLYGGKLLVIPQVTARDPREFLQVLASRQVTVLNQTPSAFYNLMQWELKEEGRKDLKLRYVIFGGEALQPGKLRSWKEKYPGTRLVNMFGVTETTVHVTYREIGREEIERGFSNIGKPIPTLRLYIMDKNRQLVPWGTPGELYVAGKGVARGYLNRPELTAEKFDRDLWDYRDYHDEKDQKFAEKTKFQKVLVKSAPPGRQRQKIYKTGDLVRLTPRGDLEYLGRIDQQVQLRGFRIELAEIESQLLKKEEIQEAVVVAGTDKTGDKYLCAYFTSSRKVELFELKEHLSVYLPSYMIPSYFLPIDHIPLTSNGKLNKKALPQPVARLEVGYVEPRSQTEKVIADVWREWLGLGNVGILDNFFDAGGNSIKAIRVASRLGEVLGEEVPVVKVFQYPTIAALASHLEDPQREKEKATIPTIRVEDRKTRLNQRRKKFDQNPALTEKGFAQ